MPRVDVPILALAGADILLQTVLKFKHQYDSYKDLAVFLDDAEDRVKRIRLITSKYVALESADASRIPGQVLERVKSEFGDIERSINELAKFLDSSDFDRVTKAQQSCEKLKNICTDLSKLEHHLESYGLYVYVEKSLSAKFDELINVMREKITVPDGPKVDQLLGCIRTNLPFCDEVPEHMRDTPYDDQLTHGRSNELFSKMPDYVRRLLESLCSSGVDENTRKQLTGMVRRLWCGWEVNVEDLFGLGEWKSIGQGVDSSVYICKLQRRDTLGKATGEKIKVAVKELKHIPNDEESDKQLGLFIRELYLQMDSRHPCIVHVFGGFLSDFRNDFDDIGNGDASSEDGEEDDEDELQVSYIKPHIVMERMSLNLRDAMKSADFKDWTLRRRILKDVADGLAHLHSRGIVHRDVKPENVLLRKVKGTIVGRAKLGDFGVSRKIHDAGVKSTYVQTLGAATTYLYMPPEVLRDFRRCVSRKSWDVWSFGVLACELGVPGCFNDILSTASYSEFMDAQNFVMDIANSIEDDVVRDVALDCLQPNRDLRPSMYGIARKLVVQESPRQSREPASSDEDPLFTSQN